MSTPRLAHLPPPRAHAPRLHLALRSPSKLLALATLGAALALYLTVLWPWMQTWGTTPDQRTRALPGDELVVGATDQSTRAVLVRAPAGEAWAWLVQIGQDRAGFYSYDWLENLVGADIHNADRVHPEWQTLRAGDVVRAIPPGYLGDALQPPGWTVAAVEPGRWFVLRDWGVFLVEPVDATTSRVIVRTRFRDETWWGPVITRLAFGPVHFVMERRMLLGIRDRVEGRTPPRALTALADAGFAVAAAGTLVLLLRRRRPWLLLPPPMLLALAIARGTEDVLAATAAFTALGLVLVGLSACRRRWPANLLVATAVLLVLLLAPDAHLAFGLTFLGIAGALALAAFGRRDAATRMARHAHGQAAARAPAAAARAHFRMRSIESAKRT